MNDFPTPSRSQFAQHRPSMHVASLRDARRRPEDFDASARGFTLIELLVVIAIIAILICSVATLPFNRLVRSLVVLSARTTWLNYRSGCTTMRWPIRCFRPDA